ncbi:MAG: Imidazolonepropionase, partial [Mucilaginibacter sp.]|nr:Imidazolonepropionase [Mucilaginibacter sp.]
MKKYILLFSFSFIIFAAGAQTKPDSVTFFLHKFEQHIGKEVYRVSKTGKEITYTSDFKFVDRGSPVPLKAELKLTPAFEPLSLKIKGNTARSATINDTITISGNQAH